MQHRKDYRHSIIVTFNKVELHVWRAFVVSNVNVQSLLTQSYLGTEILGFVFFCHRKKMRLLRGIRGIHDLKFS